jgi:hypothetical protein
VTPGDGEGAPPDGGDELGAKVIPLRRRGDGPEAPRILADEPRRSSEAREHPPAPAEWSIWQRPPDELRLREREPPPPAILRNDLARAADPSQAPPGPSEWSVWGTPPAHLGLRARRRCCPVRRATRSASRAPAFASAHRHSGRGRDARHRGRGSGACLGSVAGSTRTRLRAGQLRSANQPANEQQPGAPKALGLASASLHGCPAKTSPKPEGTAHCTECADDARVRGCRHRHRSLRDRPIPADDGAVAPRNRDVAPHRNQVLTGGGTQLLTPRRNDGLSSSPNRVPSASRKHSSKPGKLGDRQRESRVRLRTLGSGWRRPHPCTSRVPGSTAASSIRRASRSISAAVRSRVSMSPSPAHEAR